MSDREGKRGRRPGESGSLTTADLVVLSLIAEQPTHGYDLLQAYRRQEVEDWTSVSKAQLYYALNKLADEGLIAPESGEENPRGRTVYRVTQAGKDALRSGLSRQHWARARIALPFATWVGLSTHARKADIKAIVAARRTFLESELMRERASLEFIKTLNTPRAVKGTAIVRLVIAQIETELLWISTEFDDKSP